MFERESGGLSTERTPVNPPSRPVPLIEPFVGFFEVAITYKSSTRGEWAWVGRTEDQMFFLLIVSFPSRRPLYHPQPKESSTAILDEK